MFFMKLNMPLLIENEKLLKACNKVWDKISNIIQKGFDIDQVYNENYFKTKITSYDVKNGVPNGVNNGVPIEGSLNRLHSIFVRA